MKVFVQVIDTRTGVYQTGMIEENVIRQRMGLKPKEE